MPLTSTDFTPARLWSISHFGELSGNTGTNIIVNPAQYRALNPGDSTAIERLYSSVGLQLFYADPADPVFALPPSILGVSAVQPDGSPDMVKFAMHVAGSPDAPPTGVWVTYTFGPGSGGAGSWQSIDLQKSTDEPTLWSADLAVPSGADVNSLRFIVQAVNAGGNVAWDDNNGPYYTLTGLTTGYDTSVTLGSSNNPTSGVYGSTVTLTATLDCPECAGLDGKTILFQVGSSARTAVTNSSGTATVDLPLNTPPGDYSVVATFAGDNEAVPSADSAGFTVTKVPTTLTLELPTGSATAGLDSGVFATLTNGSGPMSSRSVTFVVWDGSVGGEGYSKSATTGPDGTAALGALPALPSGTYAIYAYFGDSYVADPWSGSPTTITIDDPIYQASSDQTPPGPGLQVVRPPLTVTPDPVNLTYGDPVPTYTFEVTGFQGTDTLASLNNYVAPTCAAYDSSNAEYSPLTPVASSPLTIMCSGGSADGYTFDTTATAALTIAKATSTTTVTCPDSVTYTGSAIEPCTATATGAGGLNQSLTVTYSADHTNVGTVSASATFTGDANHTGNSDSTTFTIAPALVRAEYTGDFFVPTGTAPSFSLRVVSADGSSVSPSLVTNLTATFYVFPAGCSASCPLTTELWRSSPTSVGTDATATVPGPTSLADDAYIVIGVLTDSANNVVGERAVGAFAIYPGNSTYVVGGGYVDADTGAADDPGFFGLNVKKAKNSAIGSVVYIYPLRIDDPTGASPELGSSCSISETCRDVYVLVRSTTLTSASTTQSSTWPITATATGHASVQFMDALDGHIYTNLALSKPTFRYDAYDNGAGGASDTFGISVYTTAQGSTTLNHVAADGTNPQNGTGSPTNMVGIAGTGADINAPPGNKNGQ